MKIDFKNEDGPSLLFSDQNGPKCELGFHKDDLPVIVGELQKVLKEMTGDQDVEQFTFFWGEAPFSQWAEAYFKVDGVQYNCTEQYMMAEKARLFKDKEAEEAIMKAASPHVQKKLGKTVKGFEKETWEAVARDIVYKGNRCKFEQNPEMQEDLFKTQGTTIVEASPYDVIWGIGLGVQDAGCKNRSTWKGTNWLGEVLTVLRDDLINVYNRTEFAWSDPK